VTGSRNRFNYSLSDKDIPSHETIILKVFPLSVIRSDPNLEFDCQIGGQDVTVITSARLKKQSTTESLLNNGSFYDDMN